jgi:hypothetical protein
MTNFDNLVTNFDYSVEYFDNSWQFGMDQTLIAAYQARAAAPTIFFSTGMDIYH